jgi:hypothetical protein
MQSFSGVFDGLDETVKTNKMEKGCLLAASNAKKYFVNIIVHQVSEAGNGVSGVGFNGVESVV